MEEYPRREGSGERGMVALGSGLYEVEIEDDGLGAEESMLEERRTQIVGLRLPWLR